MNFKSFLSESMDKPYPFTWKHKREMSWTGSFTADKDTVEVYFGISGPDTWAIDFERNGDSTKTGGGDSFRIFATVIAMVKEFIDEIKPEKLGFEAFKVDDEGEPDQSRIKLYASFCKRFANKNGYDFKEETGTHVNKFLLTRRN